MRIDGRTFCPFTEVSPVKAVYFNAAGRCKQSAVKSLHEIPFVKDNNAYL